MNRILILALCLAPAALPQEKTMSCDEDGSRWKERGQYCEIREATMPAGGSLDVDGGVNGGISIKGANRSDILVRSKVQTYQEDEADSRRVASEIRVEAGSGRVRATGPTSERHGWGVSYEILVPARTDLVLRTHNGGHQHRGRARTHAVRRSQRRRLVETVGGFRARTYHQWRPAPGAGVGPLGRHDRCDVSTTNGGVTIRVPSSYSAHLETGTVNGGVRIDFPVTVQGEISRHLEVDLGSGGNLVRATTTNGGVRVERI